MRTWFTSRTLVEQSKSLVDVFCVLPRSSVESKPTISKIRDIRGFANVMEPCALGKQKQKICSAGPSLTWGHDETK